MDTNPTPAPAREEVNHPAHYNVGEIEVIDLIEDWGLGFHLGNAVKYIARAGRKTPTIEATVRDLKKALWYLRRWNFSGHPVRFTQVATIRASQASVDWELSPQLSKALAAIEKSGAHHDSSAAIAAADDHITDQIKFLES
jgi:hypothetical protein